MFINPTTLFYEEIVHIPVKDEQMQNLITKLKTITENETNVLLKSLDNFYNEMKIKCPEVSAKQHPLVHQAFLETLTKLQVFLPSETMKQLKTTKVFVVEDPKPNARSYAFQGTNSVIVITSRLVDLLTAKGVPSEVLQAVFAHELGHVFNTDSKYARTMQFIAAKNQDSFQNDLKYFTPFLQKCELEADRVMCAALYDHWLCIPRMFAIVSSGESNANGIDFWNQCKNLKNNNTDDVIKSSGNHPPNAFRVNALENFRNSEKFKQFMQHKQKSLLSISAVQDQRFTNPYLLVADASELKKVTDSWSVCTDRKP
jgi:hypothetical protein